MPEESGQTIENTVNSESFEILKNKFGQAMKYAAKISDYWRKITGSFVYPNGMLDDIPVYVTEFNYSKSNSVSPNMMFLGNESIDNIEKDVFSIDLTLMCYGKSYLEELEKLRQVSEDREGINNIISFYYNKNKKIYFPLVITSINYNDSSETTRFQSVSIKLKQIKLSFLNDKTLEVTNVLKAEDFYTNDVLKRFEMPENLYDELRNECPMFKEVTDGIENFISDVQSV